MGHFISEVSSPGPRRFLSHGRRLMIDLMAV